jgi:hypothetical protein
MVSSLTGEKGEGTTRPASQVEPALFKGGPEQWPERPVTRLVMGDGKPFAIDTFPLPWGNPWKSAFYLTANQVMPDGSIAVATMQGEVWLARLDKADPTLIRWKRFATGLHQPLGMVLNGDRLEVIGRDQITRLHDLNGDEEADFYECVTNAMPTSPSGHDYTVGLERDEAGGYYFASAKDGVCRIEPGGKMTVLATGLRNPNGIGLSSGGLVTTSSQEGDWVPASSIFCVEPGDFCGAGGAKGRKITLPTLYLPRGEDNSSSGQVFLENRWGLGGANFITFSAGAGTAFLVTPQKAGAGWQAAAVRLPWDFLSGPQTGRFGPDGALYVTGMNGWGSYTPERGMLQRVRRTGGPLFLPVGWSAHENGIMLTFSDPIDRSVVADKNRHFAQCWNY